MSTQNHLAQRSVWLRVRGLILVVFGAFLAGGCHCQTEVVLSGKTMGTTYHIKLLTGYFQRTGHVPKAVEDRLRQINQSMSTYIQDSEINRFNAHRQTDPPFEASADFLQVMRVGQQLHALTGGAWDGTIHPLVNLWGFGRDGTRTTAPAPEEILRLLDRVDFGSFSVGRQHILKQRSEVTVDLASIAKGYGVDALVTVLRNLGFKHFVIEIGGEVFAAGVRKEGGPWRVGINRPQKDEPLDSIYKVVFLTDKALATSGDYRQFFEQNGRRYSHVLDPATGCPVENAVVGVSIAASSCTLADGLATAVMVMGVQRGLALINAMDGVEALIVEQAPDGRLVDHYSRGFAALLADDAP
jgi:thiamine biosynthesis lipoprotein